MRLELRRTRDNPEIANAVFDGYLCAAEYLLYGPTPYAEVIAVARDLQTTARRSGALRPPRSPRRSSARPRSCRAISTWPPRADARPATSTTTSARPPARRTRCSDWPRCAWPRATRRGNGTAAPGAAAGPLVDARQHLLQRIFGTMILAAPDPLEARAIVDRAESTMGWDDVCLFCSIMLSCPPPSLAPSGDLDHAQPPRAGRALGDAVAGHVVGGGAAEAQAAVAAAEGDPGVARTSGARRPSSSSAPVSRSMPSAAASPSPASDPPPPDPPAAA